MINKGYDREKKKHLVEQNEQKNIAEFCYHAPGL